MAAADACARGYIADADIHGIIVVDEPDGLLHVFKAVAQRRGLVPELDGVDAERLHMATSVCTGRLSVK